MAGEIKLDWSRIGDTFSGGMMVVCDIPDGAFGLEGGDTVYLKEKTDDFKPVPSRIVLTEKRLNFQDSLENFRSVLIIRLMEQGERRMERKLKELDEKKKDELNRLRESVFKRVARKLFL